MSKSVSKTYVIAVVILVVFVVLLFSAGNGVSTALSKKDKGSEHVKIINNLEELNDIKGSYTGYVYIYGDVKVAQPVALEDIQGTYAYIQRDTEIYTRHRNRKNGRRRTYYTWDTIKSDTVINSCSDIVINDIPLTVDFQYEGGQAIRTLNAADTYTGPYEIEDSYVYFGENERYIYSEVPSNFKATILCDLQDGELKVKAVYRDSTIEEAKESVPSENPITSLIFIVLPFLVVGFIIFITIAGLVLRAILRRR